jgi:hypothetical protein
VPVSAGVACGVLTGVAAGLEGVGAMVLAWLLTPKSVGVAVGLLKANWMNPKEVRAMAATINTIQIVLPIVCAVYLCSAPIYC